jgi:DNA-binding transcriptional LysR family regulator
VSPAGSPPHISTAQQPGGRTGEPPEYVQYEGRLAGTPSGNLDPPIYAPDSRRGALAWRPLGTDPVRIVLPAAHPGVENLAALRDEGWVAGCERCRANLLATCAAAGFTPDIRHVTDDYVVVQALVARGVAVSVLPEMALRATTLDGVRAHPDPALAPRTVGVLHRPGVEQVPAVAAVLDVLSTVSADVRSASSAQR